LAAPLVGNSPRSTLPPDPSGWRPRPSAGGHVPAWQSVAWLPSRPSRQGKQWETGRFRGRIGLSSFCTPSQGPPRRAHTAGIEPESPAPPPHGGRGFDAHPPPATIRAAIQRSPLCRGSGTKLLPALQALDSILDHETPP